MSKERILVISNHSFMLYRFRIKLLEALCCNNDVVVVVPFGDKVSDICKIGCKCIDVTVDRRGINPITDYKLYRQYKKIIEEVKPSKIITYSIKPNIYAGIIAGKKKIHYYMNVQGLGTAFERRFLSVVVSLLYKKAAKKASAVFFENRYDSSVFLKRRIIKESQNFVLPGAGVDLAQYSFSEYEKKDIFHFLYLGRIMKEKGFDEILEACKALYERQRFVLDVVGFCEEEYETIIRDYEKTGMIQYYGFQSDPRPFYKKADCILMPSYHEGMSNVNLEAASMGRVVITTNIPGCKEAVEDGLTGWLVKPGDWKDLFEKMTLASNITIEELSTMGKNARKKMERCFDKQLVVDRTLEIVLK